MNKDERWREKVKGTSAERNPETSFFPFEGNCSSHSLLLGDCLFYLQMMLNLGVDEGTKIQITYVSLPPVSAFFSFFFLLSSVSTFK